MSEPGNWTAPEGWGGPPPSPGYGPPPPPGYGPVPPAPGQQPYSGQEFAGATPGWGSRPAAAQPGVVPLRPLGLGELLDGAVGIIRRYPRPALGLSALVALVTTLLNVALLVTAFQPLLEVDPAALDRGDTAALEGVIGAAAGGGILTVLLAILSGVILTGGLTAVVGKAILGEPMSFTQAWSQVRPFVLRLLGLALLVVVIVYGVLIAGVLAGTAIIAVGGPVLALIGVPLIFASIAASAFFYIRLSLAPCVLVLERLGIAASLRRSSALVTRDWWRVFGILTLTLILGGFVSQVVQLPFAVLGAGSPASLFDPQSDLFTTRSLVLSAVGGGLASTLVAPFTAGVRALVYVDRRMRAEGLDVALTAAANARR